MIEIETVHNYDTRRRWFRFFRHHAELVKVYVKYRDVPPGANPDKVPWKMATIYEAIND